MSPLGPQTGVVGLFDAAFVHLAPQTSWCHSGNDLEGAFMPGEGVKRSVQVDIMMKSVGLEAGLEADLSLGAFRVLLRMLS